MVTRWLMAASVFVGSAAAAGLSDTQVSFQTTNCDGAKGFASVELERISRINPAGCATPDQPDEQLLQVVVKSSSGLTNFEVFTVRPAEAEAIQAQINAHMQTKREALQSGETVIIDR